MIILASTSKRRIDLIKKITNNYQCVKPLINEKDFHYGDNSSISKELSKIKAYSIFPSFKNDVIIAADTIVLFKDKLIEKPKDKTEAYNFLKLLSNNTHVVLTSYTILYKNFELTKTVKTYVTFNNLSDELIINYLKQNTYKDKAGGYAIQDKNFNFVKSIKGSYYNVVGFPLEDIKKDLIKYNLIDK